VNFTHTYISDSAECWPALPWASWKDTLATLQMWLQIVGKVRMALTPPTNHWWHVTLYVSTCGLTTSPIPYGARYFEIEFDFIAQQLRIRVSDGRSKNIPLAPQSVAEFYQQFMGTLNALGIEVHIWKMPVEIANPIPFDQDRVHVSYDAASVAKFWRILVSVDAVLRAFRGRFLGKSSEVHFFWGGCDLAVTRFSGRRAPERNDTDPILRKIMREAYSHEVISAGFWPGGNGVDDPAFYCYAAPQPAGFENFAVRPASAFYQSAMGEYILMYDDVRRSSSPSATLMDFVQSAYEAGAIAGKWDRASLERAPGAAAVPGN
jgi:hypothetical protein